MAMAMDSDSICMRFSEFLRVLDRFSFRRSHTKENKNNNNQTPTTSVDVNVFLFFFLLVGTTASRQFAGLSNDEKKSTNKKINMLLK